MRGRGVGSPGGAGPPEAGVGPVKTAFGMRNAKGGMRNAKGTRGDFCGVRAAFIAFRRISAVYCGALAVYCGTLGDGRRTSKVYCGSSKVGRRSSAGYCRSSKAGCKASAVSHKTFRAGGGMGRGGDQTLLRAVFSDRGRPGWRMGRDGGGFPRTRFLLSCFSDILSMIGATMRIWCDFKPGGAAAGLLRGGSGA